MVAIAKQLPRDEVKLAVSICPQAPFSNRKGIKFHTPKAPGNSLSRINVIFNAETEIYVLLPPDGVNTS